MPPLAAVPGTDRMMLRWMVKTRRYSPKSRTSLRRVVLLAKLLDVDITIDHDRGLLLRLNMVTVTGTTVMVREFQRRLLNGWSTLQHPRWNR